MPECPTLALVGGFLGAGKTTLIAAAVRALTAAGQRVVVVTNDQAPELVDTALATRTGVPVAEVAGACFCCAFTDFLARTDALVAAHHPDIILAEPVGSCVDLAATVLRPLAERCGDRLHVAPFTVCVDAAAWREAEAGRLPPETSYIYRMQVAEADLLLLTKCDGEPPAALDLVAARLAAANPAAAVLRCAATTGAGIDGWLAAARGQVVGGSRRIAVDYDTYAAGEAALGWLNAAVRLDGPPGTDWFRILASLMHDIATAAPPAHLKCLLDSGALTLVANSVTGRSGPVVRIIADGPGAATARLTINARIAMPAPELRRLVESVLAALPVAGQVRTIRAFPPGRPVPEHRIA